MTPEVKKLLDRVKEVEKENKWRFLEEGEILDLALALLPRLARELQELSQWKESSSKVLTEWNEVFESIPAEFRRQPKYLGDSKTNVVKDYINGAGL